jgi:hypothetical protein
MFEQKKLKFLPWTSRRCLVKFVRIPNIFPQILHSKSFVVL